MSAGLDEDLVERIDGMPRSLFTATCFRYSGVRRDPLSGAGSRSFGGRWNPREIFGAIYLATPAQTCALEAQRAANGLGTTPEVMLEAAYLLHTVEVREVQVLDLRASQHLEMVGLTPADLLDDDWTACQSVAHAAWFLDYQGVIAPSASGRGFVVAAFEGRLDLHQLSVKESQPFTTDLYLELQNRV